MNVWVLWNETAGRSVSAPDLRELIEEAGHRVLDVVMKRDLERRPLPRGADLVVAAGGDGTVATAARLVAEAEAPTPIAILPLGTANNIASSLGLLAPLPVLIASWTDAVCAPFDLGHARAGSKAWLLVEGVGCGWVPAGIAAVQRRLSGERAADGDPAEEVRLALRTFRDVLDLSEPSPWKITADGQSLSGDYLAVEILNIPSIGPNLVLSPDPDPADGYFDVIVARERDRAALEAYLDARLAGGDAPLQLPTHRARLVSVASCGELHVNDEAADVCQHGALTIEVVPGALRVLRPRYDFSAMSAAAKGSASSVPITSCAVRSGLSGVTET